MPVSTPRDQNRIPAMLATLNTDGLTVQPLTVNPVTHRVKVSNGTSGSSLTWLNAQRDANRIAAVLGVQSNDGITIIPPYCNTQGELLIKSS